jgi:hypothetical protein
MTSNNQLVLSLSHKPVPQSLLASLVERTASLCEDVLQEHSRQPRERAPTVHMLVTGCPRIIMPGKAQPEYVSHWTPGERILARAVDRIGMNKFHRDVNSDGVKLIGRLVDIKPNDYRPSPSLVLSSSLSSNDSSSNATTDEDTSNVNDLLSMAKWRDRALEEELAWIADRVFRYLVNAKVSHLEKATILFPLKEEIPKEDDISKLIWSVFRQRWATVAAENSRSNEGGLMVNETEINVIIVR